jgi:hypothetical protein
MEHFPALALVRRGAFANNQWKMEGALLLAVRKDDAPGFIQTPSQIVSKSRCRSEPWRTSSQALERLPRTAFDFVWMIDPPKGTRVPPDLVAIWTNGKDTVYRIKKDVGPNDAISKGSVAQ